MAGRERREARRRRARACSGRGGSAIAGLAAAAATATRRPPGRRRSDSSAAVDLEPQAVLAAGGDLARSRPCRARRGRSRTAATAASSVATSRISPRRRRARTPAAVAVQALGDRGQHARAQARDAVAGDELGQVAPVRADVGERARGAAEVRVDAPVVVLGRAAASPAGRCRGSGGPAPRGARADALARLARRSGSSGRRTGRPRTRPALGGRVGQRAARRARSSASGFSQMTCLPAAQRGLGERQVQVVGRADVHDVDVVGRRRAPRSCRRRARRRSRRPRRSARAGEEAATPDDACRLPGARPSGVDGADEAGAGDRHASPRPRHVARGHCGLADCHGRKRREPTPTSDVLSSKSLDDAMRKSFDFRRKSWFTSPRGPRRSRPAQDPPVVPGPCCA